MKNKADQKKPLVSVIMPVYNAGNFLVEAIESILKQTYQNFEFIIINDHSTDNSWDIIQKYQKKYPKKIKAINLKRNLNKGGDACANVGLSKAKGKYIARMDADDIAHPQRLEKQVKFLEKNKDVFLVGSNAKVIDKEGKVIGIKKVPTSYEDIYKSFFTFNPIIHPTVIFRRVIKGKVFSYPKKFSANNDYYFFFKMLCKDYKFVNLREELLYYRIHGNNDTFNNMREKFLNTLRIRLIMVLKYKYRPTLKQWLINIAQLIAIFLLPSQVAKKIYLLSKGIINISNRFENFGKFFILKRHIRFFQSY